MDDMDHMNRWREKITADMRAEGFSEQEILLAGVIGEFKTALKMLANAEGRGEARFAGMAMSQAFATLFEEAIRSAGLSEEHTMSAARRLETAVKAEVQELTQRPHGGMDSSGPDTPSQVN